MIETPITSEQLDQILASGMSLFPAVTCAVSMATVRTDSSAGVEVVLPQVSSMRVRTKTRKDCVAYVVIPADVRSIDVDTTKLSAALFAFPKQPVSIHFDGTSMNCNEGSGVSVSATTIIPMITVSRNDSSWTKELYVPFHFQTGDTESLTSKASTNLGQAWFYVKVPPPRTTDYSIVAIETTSIQYHAKNERTYQVSIPKCGVKLSIAIPVYSGLVDIHIPGALSWKVQNVTVYQNAVVRIPHCGTFPWIVLDDVITLSYDRVVDVSVTDVVV